MEISIFDVVVIALLIWGVIKGFRNGLIIELSSLAALVVGIIAAMYLSDWVNSIIKQWTDFQYTAIIAFVVVFIGIIIGMHYLAKALTSVVEVTALNLFNRILGSLFSVMVFAFIISVFVSFFAFLDWDEKYFPPSDKAKSKLYEPISKFAPAVFPYIQLELEKDDADDHDVNPTKEV